MSILVHELTHSLQHQMGSDAFRDVEPPDANDNGTSDHEEAAVDTANEYRAHFEEPQREGYDDQFSSPGVQAFES